MRDVMSVIFSTCVVLLFFPSLCSSSHVRRLADDVSICDKSGDLIYAPRWVNQMHRTRYHFRPPKNWINDPNGPMYHNGLYHFFYQYNPNNAFWGDIVWAHSVSTDLINWHVLEPAIYASKPFDKEGCWSGSATILPGNIPAILYTGIDADDNQIQNVAYPDDISDPYLRKWTKPDYNPIISAPANINSSYFRDPSTAWQGPDGVWRIVIGARVGDRGVAPLYRSKDFKHWTKAEHPLHSKDGTGMWECPDFFPVAIGGKEGVDTSVIGKGYKHVFKVSLDVTRFEYYTLGKYYPKVDIYVPSNHSADDRTGLRYDYGNFYASKTFYDPKEKRRVLWGWANESDHCTNYEAKGWAGIQTIPRTILLDEGGKQLKQWPVKELDRLRGIGTRVNGLNLGSGKVFHVKGIQTNQADIEVTFRLSGLHKAELWDPSWSADPQKLCGMKGTNVVGGVGPFGLFVLASRNLAERTAVTFRVFRNQHSNKHVLLVCQDPTSSTWMRRVYKPTFGGVVEVDLRKHKKITVRTLVDNSVVESFAEGGKVCITSRVYPLIAVGRNANLFAFNNGTSKVQISQLRAWEMKNAKIN